MWITKHGRYEVGTAVCDECGCTFEFTPMEVKAPKGLSVGTEWDYLRCPGCGHPVFLHRNEAKGAELLPSPFGTAFPAVYRDEVNDTWNLVSADEQMVITVRGRTRQEVVEKWNRRK